MFRLEIIALTLEDALAAQAGGATSVEIVADRAVGGLTPSVTVVRAIRDAVTIDLNVMVRPHARSFCYDDSERDMILADTASLVRAGATTIVFGALKGRGKIDLEMMQQVTE